MVNISIIIFLLLFLITQKVLLLNEESLILLCFVTFVIFSSNSLSVSINNSLKNQSLQIKTSLIQSLRETLLMFKKFSTLHKNYQLVLEKFKELKRYYNKLVFLLAKLVLPFNKYYLNISYTKKLNFLNKTEEQTIKLLTTIILKKLNLIVKNKHFYNFSIQLPQFICLNSILLRECIQLINSKKI